MARVSIDNGRTYYDYSELNDVLTGAAADMLADYKARTEYRANRECAERTYTVMELMDCYWTELQAMMDGDMAADIGDDMLGASCDEYLTEYLRRAQYDLVIG